VDAVCASPDDVQRGEDANADAFFLGTDGLLARTGDRVNLCCLLLFARNDGERAAHVATLTELLREDLKRALARAGGKRTTVQVDHTPRLGTPLLARPHVLTAVVPCFALFRFRAAAG